MLSENVQDFISAIGNKSIHAFLLAICVIAIFTYLFELVVSVSGARLS